MGRPRKVKTVGKTAMNKTKVKKVKIKKAKKLKNTFLQAGKEYRFYMKHMEYTHDDFVATLLNMNETEYLVKDQYGELILAKQYVIKVHENIEDTESALDY